MKPYYICQLILLSLMTAAVCRPAAGAVTNELRPELYWEFAGRDDPVDIASVSIRLDGRDVSGLAGIEDWRLTYRPAEPLAPGLHSAVAVVYDSRGARLERTWELVVDPEAPDTIPPRVEFVDPTPPDGAILKSGAGVTIAAMITDSGGSGMHRDTISISTQKDGRFVSDICSFPSFRQDSFICRLGRLETGVYRISISARDVAGNKSGEKALTFTVDSFRPSIVFSLEPEILSPDELVIAEAELADYPEGGLDRWSVSVLDSAGGTIEEFTSPAVQGLNRILFRAFEVEQDPNGPYRVKARVVDRAGNVTESPGEENFIVQPRDIVERHLGIDTYHKESTEEIVPPPHDLIPSFPEKSKDTGEPGNVEMISELTAPDDGPAGAESTARNVDRDDIVILRTDNEGGAFREAEDDKTPPSIFSVSPPDGRTLEDVMPVVSFSYEDIGGSGVNAGSVRLTIDDIDYSRPLDKQAGTAAYRPPEPLDPGPHNVKVSVSDNAGNISHKQWSFRIAPPSVTDSSPPSITFLNPPDDLITSRKVIMLKARLEDNVSVDANTVTLTVDMRDVSIEKLCAFDKYDELVCRLVLGEGKHRISLSCADGEGNRNSAGLAITVDSDSPQIVVTSHYMDQKVFNNTIQLSGRIYDRYGFPVTVTVNGKEAEVNDNYWTAGGLRIGNGINVIEIYAVDVAGNSSEHSIRLKY